MVGNGTHISVLEEAGAADADMLIACAAADETNLVACKIAKQIFNVPRCIARVRSPEFLDQPELMGDDGFCVDHLICPERSVTDYLDNLIEIPEALQVVEFADGRVSAVTVRAVGRQPAGAAPDPEPARTPSESTISASLRYTGTAGRSCPKGTP